MSSNRAGFVFYRDVFGGWRWEHTDATGHITDSHASYETRRECVAAAGAARIAERPAPDDVSREPFKTLERKREHGHV